MPVNTKARYYQWFMTDNPDARVVAFEWWPSETPISSSMALGKMVMMKRDEPEDTWGPPQVVAEDIIWAVAQNLAHSQGFTTEVAIV